MNKYPFQLESLPYDYVALEPVIDRETMMVHHDKHHQAYVDNLNKALEENVEEQNKGLEELLESEVQAVRNNAGGVVNHNLFWQMMVSVGKTIMSEKVKLNLEKYFGSVEEFMKKFEGTALSRFGSGWAFLVVNKEGDWEVMSMANQENPITLGYRVLLALDVWEHAYYLKYKNKRAEYVHVWWQVVNWEEVERRLG